MPPGIPPGSGDFSPSDAVDPGASRKSRETGADLGVEESARRTDRAVDVVRIDVEMRDEA